MRLRQAATETIAIERGNLEGAAAFAAYTARRSRRSVIEALVAFQAMYDFADTLAEHDVDDPMANAQALHEALVDALAPSPASSCYYAHYGRVDDGGYLVGLVNRCRSALASLPSYPRVEKPLRRAVRRMVDYQTLIHGGGKLAPIALVAWARDETPTGSGLRWWETAAAGASSLVAFALIAAAADPMLSAREVQAIEATYFPWFGALHVLLDSLVDRPEDADSGHHSLVANYASSEETSRRIGDIGSVALASAKALPHPDRHTLLLVAMTGFYLAKPSARLPYAAETRRRLISVLGAAAWPVLLVHWTRHQVGAGPDRN